MIGWSLLRNFSRFVDAIYYWQGLIATPECPYYCFACKSFSLSQRSRYLAGLGPDMALAAGVVGVAWLMMPLGYLSITEREAFSQSIWYAPSVLRTGLAGDFYRSPGQNHFSCSVVVYRENGMYC